MERPLRLGVAGLGNAGHQVVRAVSKTPGVELAAAADARREALESFAVGHAGVRLFDHVAGMCDSPEVDAVWIATPNEFHAEHAVAAAERGKHVICEKPMAVNLEECDRMIEAAERSRVKLLIGHSKISDPPVVKMGEVVSGGSMGPLIQIATLNYKGWLQSARLPAEVDTSKGGGVVYRQGPHQVDIVRYIGGGLVRSVRAVAGKWNPHFDTEGNYTAFLEFADGTPATLVFNGYGYFDVTELTWDIGEGGEKVTDRYGVRERLKGAVAPAVRYAMPLRRESRARGGERKQPFYGITVVSCARGDIRQSPDGLYLYTEEGCREVPCMSDLGRGAELLKLRDAVTRNQPVFPDGRWGKATLEVVLAILESSRSGREVILSRQVARASFSEARAKG
jgi:phthalate 4,5-cis-dihydrodiol dehydrogenase